MAAHQVPIFCTLTHLAFSHLQWLLGISYEVHSLRSVRGLGPTGRLTQDGPPLCWAAHRLLRTIGRALPHSCFLGPCPERASPLRIWRALEILLFSNSVALCLTGQGNSEMAQEVTVEAGAPGAVIALFIGVVSTKEALSLSGHPRAAPASPVWVTGGGHVRAG